MTQLSKCLRSRVYTSMYANLLDICSGELHMAGKSLLMPTSPQAWWICTVQMDSKYSQGKAKYVGAHYQRYLLSKMLSMVLHEVGTEQWVLTIQEDVRTYRWSLTIHVCAYCICTTMSRIMKVLMGHVIWFTTCVLRTYKRTYTGVVEEHTTLKMTMWT